MSSQLQNLSNQFNTLLTQYTDTYQDYINLINSDNNNLTTVPNFSFVGQNNISTLNNSNINDCTTACSSNSSCSGATFNNNLNNCVLSSGSGNIVPTSNSTAIIQQAIYYSYQLQKLNSQLMDVNSKMIDISKSSYSEFQQTQQQTQQQEQLLQSNYNTLTQERNQINQMVNQYETINSAYENGSINVTSNYFSYIGLLFIVLLLLFILIKLSGNSQQRGGGNWYSKDLLNDLFFILRHWFRRFFRISTLKATTFDPRY